MSNLAIHTKIIEKVVAIQLTSYLQDDKLNEVLQSSYEKYHLIETALFKLIIITAFVYAINMAASTIRRRITKLKHAYEIN